MYAPALPVVLLAAILAAPVAAQSNCTTEDFEAFVVAAGAQVLGVLSLDENTVAVGQGPGLVQDGCVYSCTSGSLQWNDAGYFGAPSRNLVGNATDGDLHLDYDLPVNQVSLSVAAYSGVPDFVTITAYDGSGNTVASASFAIAGATPLPVFFLASGIEKVVIDGANNPWSPLLDDHQFCTAAPVPHLALAGNCGQSGSGVSGSGMTPNGTVGIAYSTQIGPVNLPGGPCAGTLVSIVNPIVLAVLTADANGDIALLPPGGIPTAGCGAVHVQALDLSSCTTSNVLSL